MDNDEIRKVIESCHINFLIGSGASMPFLGTLGSIEELLTDLSRKEDSDTKTIIDASIKKHYFDVAINGNLEISTTSSQDLDETKSAYEEFVKSLNTIMTKRNTNLISKQINIFTTNMDIFLEHSLEKNNFVFNDGFTGRFVPKFSTQNFHNIIIKTSTHYEYQYQVPLFNIFKLHGSVNWKEVDSNIVLDYSLETLKKVSKIEFPDEVLFEIESYDEHSEKWTHSTIQELYDCQDELEFGESQIELSQQHLDFISAYNEILMINPTKEKFETTTRDHTFYELLRMYSNHLERENSVLFVIGFSFADEHICEITKRVAKSNPTLIIIIFAHSQTSSKEYRRIFADLENVVTISPKKNEKLTLKSINNSYFSLLANELLKQNA